MKNIRSFMQQHPTPSITKFKGYTLLEIMIAMSITGLVLSSLVVVQNIFLKITNLFDRSLMQMETSLNAAVLLKHHIRLTGYMVNPQKPETFKALIYPNYLSGCSKNTQNNEIAFCNKLNRHSDTAAFGHDANDSSTWKLSNGQYADCRGYGLAENIDRAIFSLRQSNTNNAPQLYCSSGNGQAAQAIFDDVQSFQVKYLLFPSNLLLPAHLLSPQDWEKVVAVEFCLNVKLDNHINSNQMRDLNEADLSKKQRNQLIKMQIALRNIFLNQ